MTTTSSPQTGVDNYAWLEMIDSHPDLSAEDLMAAYAILGVETTLTPDREFWGAWHLETYGFLTSETQPRCRIARWLRRPVSVKYTLLLPDRIVTDAELDEEWLLP